MIEKNLKDQVLNQVSSQVRNQVWNAGCYGVDEWWRTVGHNDYDTITAHEAWHTGILKLEKKETHDPSSTSL